MQPPQLRTICYVMFENLLHVLYDSTLLSFFSLLFFFPFFFSLFYLSCCLLMCTIFHFYLPFVLTISFFVLLFSSQNFFYGYFSTFQTYVSSQHFFKIFFRTELIFHLFGLFQYNFHLIL